MFHALCDCERVISSLVYTIEIILEIQKFSSHQKHLETILRSIKVGNYRELNSTLAT